MLCGDIGGLSAIARLVPTCHARFDKRNSSLWPGAVPARRGSAGPAAHIQRISGHLAVCPGVWKDRRKLYELLYDVAIEAVVLRLVGKCSMYPVIIT